MSQPIVTPGAIPQWTLGWRLQRALSHAEMNVEEMASELGVVRATVSRWMHDKGAPPKAAYIKQWALRTGVPYLWLQDGVEPNGPTPVLATPTEDKRCLFSSPDQDAQIIPLRRAS